MKDAEAVEELLEASGRFEHYDYKRLHDEVESIVESLSHISDRALTLSEVISAISDPHSDAYVGFLDSYKVLSAIYPHWVDRRGLAQRSDNYLSPSYKAEGWKKDFVKELSLYVIKSGSVVSLSRSHSYGWTDGEALSESFYAPSQILGAYNLEEMSWSEFGGTFAEDYDKIGMQIDVLYKDGQSRTVRLDGSMSDFLSAILKK